jgi:hypothetical protein
LVVVPRSVVRARRTHIGRMPYCRWTSSFSNAQTVAAARLRTPAFW